MRNLKNLRVLINRIRHLLVLLCVGIGITACGNETANNEQAASTSASATVEATSDANSNVPATTGSDRSEITIAYDKFVLDNGLTLIVHKDDKAPVVAVNVWYHVGSKDEKPGRTGFCLST